MTHNYGWPRVQAVQRCGEKVSLFRGRPDSRSRPCAVAKTGTVERNCPPFKSSRCEGIAQAEILEDRGIAVQVNN
jgi:hypothetical protein